MGGKFTGFGFAEREYMLLLLPLFVEAHGFDCVMVGNERSVLGELTII